MPKDRFLVLLQHEALAGLQTRIDAETLMLDITGQDGSPHQFDLGSAKGQSDATHFFTELLGLPEEERPFFAQSHPHRFTDVSVVSEQMMNAISVINRASVRALEEKTGHVIDPDRFRGNIQVDGWPPFVELDLVGGQIQLGEIRFDVLKRTRRCPATMVNPVTAERDLDVPRLIKDSYGHLDMGIYVQAKEAGSLHIGDTAQIL